MQLPWVSNWIKTHNISNGHQTFKILCLTGKCFWWVHRTVSFDHVILISNLQVLQFTGSNSVQAWIDFARLSLCNCLSCIFYCNVLLLQESKKATPLFTSGLLSFSGSSQSNQYSSKDVTKTLLRFNYWILLIRCYTVCIQTGFFHLFNSNNKEAFASARAMPYYLPQVLIFATSPDAVTTQIKSEIVRDWWNNQNGQPWRPMKFECRF